MALRRRGIIVTANRTYPIRVFLAVNARSAIR